MRSTVTQPARPSPAVPLEDRHFRTDHLRTGLKRRSVRGLAITLTVQALRFVLSTASIVVLARLLTPDDFGLLAMVTVLTTLVGMFSDAGLSTATVQRAEVTQAQVSTLFWINMLLSAAFMVAIAASAPVVSWFYGRSELFWITLAMAGTLLFSGLSIQHQALLRRQMRFGVMATINLVSMAVGLVAAVLMAWAGAGYWALVGMYSATPAAGAALVWLVCDWRPGWPQRRCGVWPMVTYGGNLTGYNLVNHFARNIDNVLIGWWWGAGPLGFYAKAYALLLFPIRQFNTPMASVVVPALSRLQDDPQPYRQAYLRVVERLALLTMPLAGFLIAAARPTVLVVLGPQWEPAADIFGWLGLCALVQPVANTTGWLFMSQGRTRDMFRIGMIQSALVVLAVLIGLPWGALGVAACYAASDLLLRTPLLFWFVGREGPIRLRDYATTVAPSLLIALCVWLAVSGLRLVGPNLSPLADLAASSVVAVLAAGILCLVLRRPRAVLCDLYALVWQIL